MAVPVQDCRPPEQAPKPVKRPALASAAEAQPAHKCGP